jgi:hypothetical protein
MKIKPKDHFYRDDYSVAVGDIRLVREGLDAETGGEFWQTDTVIYIDDFIYKYHGFKTQNAPTRQQMTTYMNVIVPEIFQHESH